MLRSRPSSERTGGFPLISYRSRTTWPWVVAGTGLLMLALSFVPEWLVHHREMRGEGYRTLTIGLNAWQLRSVPVLTAGVVAAVLTAVLGAAWSRRGEAPGAWLPMIGAASIGFLVAAAWPIAHLGQVSSVWISPGWILPVAIGLGTLLFLGAARMARVSRRALLGVLGVAVLALGLGVAARTMALTEGEADRPHWSDGSYSRASADGERETLSIADGSYRIGSWSGTFQASGLTVVLTDDPACPEARGAYRIFDAGEEDIRWEMIVDVCGDGARAEALVGTWERDP